MTRDLGIAGLLELADEEQRFGRIGDLVRQDAEAALAVGEHLIASTIAKERSLGADVLGQLAAIAPEARGQIAAGLLAALDPQDEGDVIASFVIALGHAPDPRAKGVLVSLSEHPDSSVRFAVAFALPVPGVDEGTAGILRLLSRDADPDVRDWATFALAESDLTDEETKQALLARAGDTDDDTRAEAIYGLARRRDPRTREFVERELASAPVGALILRARDELASGASPRGAAGRSLDAVDED